MSDAFDFVIIGGGIVGLTVARSLIQKGAGRIVILEKESRLGMHASGRNSGVLHAGLYYAPGSLKAMLCIEGAQRMKAYAAEKNIPCLPLGKVIVAQNAKDLPRLEALYQRAKANGVTVEKFTPAQLADHEPEARTHEWALFSPSTAVIDPLTVIEHLQNDLDRSGRCTLRLSTPFQSADIHGREMQIGGEKIPFGHLINTAGLYADRIAHQMGIGRSYALLPFRGGYRKVRPDFGSRIRGLVYPVPDPLLPFLGVHLTRTVHGDVYVGPTAEPAWGRENYAGLQGITGPDTLSMLSSMSRMGAFNVNGFRSHVIQEMKKMLPGGLWRAAKSLAPALRRDQLEPCAKVGIRAQLIRRDTQEFVHDFVIEKGENSTHILNAVSPAFTASMAFAEHIVGTLSDRKIS